MAVTYVAGASGNDGISATTASVGITIPASAAAGDTAVVLVSTSVAAATFTAPSGWSSLHGPDTNGTSIVAQVYVKNLVSGDLGSTVTFTASASGWLIGNLSVFRGSSAGSVFTVAPATPASGATALVSPTVSTTVANSGVHVVWTGRRGGSAAARYTVPGGYTAGPYTHTLDGVSPNYSAQGEYLTTPGAAGTYGGDTTTSNLGIAPVGYTIVVPPTSGPGSASASGSVTVGGSATGRAPATASGAVALSGRATPTAPKAATAAGTITVGGSATGGVPRGFPQVQVSTTRWAWAIGPWTGLPTMELAKVTSRSCKLRLTGTSEASFTLDGSVPSASQIQELVTDLWIMRDGFTLYRGRVGPTNDNVDGTRHTVSVTTGDYRALLDRRELFDADTLTYTTQDQSAIAWGLLSSTQGKSGGALNITPGLGQTTGVTRTITYPAGQSVGQAITALSLMDSGFNWDITPATGQVGQSFNVWPYRGEDREREITYPGNVASFTRAVDPGMYANAIREIGNTGLAAVKVEAPDLDTRPEGRWDAQLGDTTLLDAGSVSARANRDLADREQVVPTWTVKLQPGTWGGPTDIWLGDTVLLAVNSGRLAVSESLRVFEIDIDLSEDNVETVTLVLSALDPNKRSRSRQVQFRLTNLERR